MGLTLKPRPTLLIMLALLGLCSRRTNAFQQPQSAATAPPAPRARRGTDGESSLTMRLRALRLLHREKEALELFEIAPVDVKEKLAQFLIGAQESVNGASRMVYASSGMPWKASYYHAVLGEYDDAVRAASQAIETDKRATAQGVSAGSLQPYLTLHLYVLRAVASSAAGNRIGSERDFRTALDICRKADCPALSEGDIYFRRGLSSFLSGDVSPAANDCRVFSQFGPVYQHAKPGSTPAYPAQQDADAVCAFIVSSAPIEATGSPGTGSGGASGTSSGGASGTSSGDIRAEMDEIQRSGHFTAMPAPIRTGNYASSPGSFAQVVENATAYELRVLFSGPVDQEFVIQPGATQRIALPAGEYRVAAKVSNPTVLPYYGTQSYDGGSYSSRFYIR